MTVPRDVITTNTISGAIYDRYFRKIPFVNLCTVIASRHCSFGVTGGACPAVGFKFATNAQGNRWMYNLDVM